MSDYELQVISEEFPSINGGPPLKYAELVLKVDDETRCKVDIEELFEAYNWLVNDEQA